MLHQSQLRGWVKALADDPQHAFPGQGQMKPEQLEIAQLKREVIRLKAERDILKKSRGLLREGNRREVRFYCEAPGDLAGGMVVRGARCLAGWVLCLADTHRAVGAAGAMKSSARRFAQASSPATGPMAPGGCGTTCWRRVCRADCIGSSV